MYGKLEEPAAARQSFSIWLQPQRHVLTVVFVFLVAHCPGEIFFHFIASNKFNVILPKLHLNTLKRYSVRKSIPPDQNQSLEGNKISWE